MESENHDQNHPEHKRSSERAAGGFPQTFSLFSAILNSQENLEVMIVENHMVFNNEECHTGVQVWRCGEETSQAPSGHDRVMLGLMRGTLPRSRAHQWQMVFNGIS